MKKRWMLEGKIDVNGGFGSRVITQTPFRIGRRQGSSLALARSTVSGHHAELLLRGDRLFLRDLSSTNGTFINGRRVTTEAEVHERDTIQFADVTVKVSCLLRQSESRTAEHDCLDHAIARVQFEKLMAEGLIAPHFQPIVDLKSQEFVAFEVLGRSCLPGLESPQQMFAAAADLKQEAELSDLMRTKGVEISQQFTTVPHIFLNTHPAEFIDRCSWDWIQRLRESSPSQLLTIEIHEGAVTDVESLVRMRSILKDFEIHLAFDDFGAGQARIAELAEVRPEYLKFDRQLLSKLDEAGTARQRFVKGLVDAVRDIGVIPLAEGIETEAEEEICRELGFQLAQGYLFGFPSPVSTYRDGNQQNEWSGDSLVLKHVASVGTL